MPNSVRKELSVIMSEKLFGLKSFQHHFVISIIPDKLFTSEAPKVALSTKIVYEILQPIGRHLVASLKMCRFCLFSF